MCQPSSLSQLLCRCILKDSQKYFTTKLNPSDVSVFWIRVHGRKTHFYTVVYVNNVHITGPPAHLRWSTPTKEKTSSFAKRKTFFLMYISLCFYTKRAKKIMWKDIHWVSMYSNVYDVGLWRTSRFCFYAFSFLNPPSSDVPHTHSPCFSFMFCHCSSVGPEVFAFSLSPSVLCVNLCYYEWAFCLVHLLHRTRWTVSQRNKTRKPEDIKEIKQRRKWYTGGLWLD